MLYCDLYIPIWFYSNLITLATPDHGLHFTFQSGSIQIQWVAVCRCPLCTLHSNLVLFKSSCSCLPLPPIKLYIPIWFYSNVQSVSLYLCLKNLYIPIWFYSNETIRQTQPNYLFSLHSNLVLFKWYTKNNHFKFVYFTFQSGSIQIISSSVLPTYSPNFTFQSGSIQIKHQM